MLTLAGLLALVQSCCHGLARGVGSDLVADQIPDECRRALGGTLAGRKPALCLNHGVVRG